MGPIRVAIADDHKIFRKGVILSLRSYTNILFVQEVNDGEELIEGLSTYRPEVVLLDLKMPKKDGIETTKWISREYPDIKIIILTMFEDERYVGHLMEHGANGYILKSADPSEIRKAILEARAKGFYLNSFVNRVLLKKSHAKVRTQPSLGTDTHVNEKEKEVIQLLCMEYTASEIAQKMEISPRTVEAIKDRLMERFGTRNTAGLVFYAVKNHIVD
jgi:DNA-binding NarL/FixJ family response regulator